MKQRSWACLGLALLLVTSGCIGVLGGSSETTTSTATPETTTATTPTTPTTDEASENDDGGGEASESRSPVYDAVQNHEDRLRSAGSFTANLVQNRSTGSQAVNITARMRMDLEADEYGQNVTGTVAGTELTIGRYTLEDTTYERLQLGSREQVRSDSEPYGEKVQPVNVTRAMGGANFLTQMGKIDLEKAGTATFRGEQMTKFTASGPEAWDVALPQGASKVTSFQMTVLVDDQGIARVIEYTMEGESSSGGSYHEYYRLEITKIGETSVDVPDWTEKAKSGLLRD